MANTTSPAADAADPFLLRFATPRRSEEADMPGRYSPEAGVWVVEVDGTELPIVEVAAGALVATQSKTMVWQEADDDDPGRGPLMETSTVTRVRQEADDKDADLSQSPGLEEGAPAL